MEEGAKEATGLAVIIDVFRAFTCAPLFFYLDAKEVILEEDPSKALSLKQESPGSILVGEVNEVPIEGGDAGNSPSEIIQKGEKFFKGRTVIHRTTAGVRGAVMAQGGADLVLAGSFVMAKAIAEFIKRNRPKTVTLVAMGDRAKARAPEDEACADYLEHLLTGAPYDHIHTLSKVVFQPTAQKFIQGTIPYLPREDPIFCLQRDLFRMVLKVEKRKGKFQLVPIEI